MSFTKKEKITRTDIFIPEGTYEIGGPKLNKIISDGLKNTKLKKK